VGVALRGADENLVDLERLLARLRQELHDLFEAECNFKVIVNGSAGRKGSIEVTKYVKF
jgi:hypothetical protein